MRSLLAFGLGLFAFSVAHACNLPHPAGTPHLKGAMNETGYWAGPAVSGAWFDPERSGEGVIVEVLPDGRALALWFTYSAAGEVGEQAWLLAQDGVFNGNSLRFTEVSRPQGARFGAAFDAAQVVYEPWGSLEMRFDDCDSAQFSWSGPAAYGAGSRRLIRLSRLDELECGGARKLTPSGARSMQGLRSRSGAWYVPERAGEGWIIEELGDGQTLMYWFTFDPDGRQAWTVGVGQRQGNRLLIEDVLIARGTRFGENFRAADVQLVPWGSLEFDFSSCQGGQLSYQSTLPGFGGAERSLTRLTSLAGAPCLDRPPGPPAAPRWASLAPLPSPATSEHAVTASGDALYSLGGLGSPRAFRRYNRASNSWTNLPDMPAGRDHLAAFALDGGVYMVGGAALGSGQQDVAAFRYDIAASSWQAVPQLSTMFGSHAAVLHGQAYIGNNDGSLQHYDPRQQRRRMIAPASFLARDHSQVVAFMDEIWMIGGREPETVRVSIYDPISERWREGPPINRRRGGFAAATVGDRIVIAGGEVIFSGIYIEGSSEVFSAGDDAWLMGPPLPVAVHGTVGGSIGGRFIVVGGATVPATTAGTTGAVHELTLD